MTKVAETETKQNEKCPLGLLAGSYFPAYLFLALLACSFLGEPQNPQKWVLAGFDRPHLPSQHHQNWADGTGCCCGAGLVAPDAVESVPWCCGAGIVAPDGVDSSPWCCVVSCAGLLELELVLLALLLLVVTDLVVLLSLTS